ncbi:putativebeta-glucosidase btgE [Rhizoctonia solani]|uniref:beta-glucosidase n=1 Tax=Rhizoctonia solani TaxID=456999 RepID=A0A8H7H184_9AGAM|nr:putativebeta-glucosidase btgE [Rhizoctonia solani]
MPNRMSSRWSDLTASSQSGAEYVCLAPPSLVGFYHQAAISQAAAGHALCPFDIDPKARAWLGKSKGERQGESVGIGQTAPRLDQSGLRRPRPGTIMPCDVAPRRWLAASPVHAGCLQNRPLGIRFADQVTAFPASMNGGATWDRDMIRCRGEAMARELKRKGVHVALGP